MNDKNVPESRLHDIKVGDEPFMTYLLPLSILLFIYARYSDPDEFTRHCLFFSYYQWMLSLKNVIIGPLKKDSGIILWALLAGFTHYEHKMGMTIMCAYASVANGFVFWAMAAHKPWHNGFHRAAKYFKKSVLWAQIMFYYLLVSAIFWGSMGYTAWYLQ